MANEEAKAYAKSVAEGIWENYRLDHVFGYDEDRLEYGEDAELSAIDYLQDVLDINYVLNESRDYIGAFITITAGGPHAVINTMERRLEVTWWTEKVYEPLPASFCNGLDEALGELYTLG